MSHPPKPRLARMLPLALAIGAFAATCGNASAQSLQDLYARARDYDATYLAARAQADATQFRADQARALRLPNIGLVGSTFRSTSDTPYSDTRSADGTVSELALNGEQTLFNRANDATITQADRAVGIALSQLRGAEQDLIVRVAQAYFDVLSAADTIGTVQSSKKAISEQLASAKRNFEVGTATITDTREAQARYDLAVAQEIAADNDLRVKQLALQQTVGVATAVPRPLAVPVVLPPLVPAAIDEWVLSADVQSPAVQQARLALEVAELETAKARAGNLPTVTLSGSYARSNVSQAVQAGSTIIRPSGTGSTATLGITLNLPLFAGFSIQNRIKETLSLEERATGDLEFARRGVAQNTRQAFFGVQSGLAQVKALEAAESSSKLALEATQLGYKVGVRVNIDVLNAQTQLYQTQRDLSKARYDAVMGGLRLRLAAGLLLPTDVAAVIRCWHPEDFLYSSVSLPRRREGGVRRCRVSCADWAHIRCIRCIRCIRHIRLIRLTRRVRATCQQRSKHDLLTARRGDSGPSLRPGRAQPEHRRRQPRRLAQGAR